MLDVTRRPTVKLQVVVMPLIALISTVTALISPVLHSPIEGIHFRLFAEDSIACRAAGRVTLKWPC